MNKKYQVFVSSTFEDLQEERKKVMEALLQMNCFPVGMEYFNASDESQWDVIKSLIDECDYYVLIVAGRYGSIEESTGKSYTQKEYEYALSINIPTIAFLYKDDSSLPRAKTEIDPMICSKLELFKNDVKKHLCKFWESSDQLASQVVLSLNSLIHTKPRTGWVKGDMTVSSEASAEILKLRNEIDDLNKKLQEVEIRQPVGTEDLSQGDDEIILSFFTNLGDSEEERISWNDLLSLLGPHMLVESSEEDLKNALDEHFRFYIGYNRTWLIVEEDFRRVIVQMLALGLIQESTRTHSTSDKNIYWTLTPWGRNLLLRLKAIRRQ